jgi:hypothetical protein
MKGQRGRAKGIGGELLLARRPQGDHAGVSFSGGQQQGGGLACPEKLWEGERRGVVSVKESQGRRVGFYRPSTGAR